MPVQEQVENLTIELQETLDFDELESKIYLSLLRTGPITASGLAKELHTFAASPEMWGVAIDVPLQVA